MPSPFNIVRYRPFQTGLWRTYQSSIHTNLLVSQDSAVVAVRNAPSIFATRPSMTGLFSAVTFSMIALANALLSGINVWSKASARNLVPA